MHPEDGDLVLYGGQGNSATSNWSFGLCRSTNGGTSWSRTFVEQGLRGYALALAVAPSGPDTVYAGGWINSAGAVAVSTDRGLTWSRTAMAPAETVFGLEVQPDDPELVYAATTGGVYRSTDAGATWLRIHGLGGLRAVASFPGCPDTLVAAGDRGVVVSEDGGQNWSDMSSGLGEHPVRCLEFTVMDAVYLYAGTADAAAYRYSFLTGIAGPGPVVPDRAGLSVLPTVASHRIRLTSPLDHRVAVRVVDASGRVALRTSMTRAADIDVTGLVTGVYEVVPEAGTGLRPVRFVVRH